MNKNKISLQAQVTLISGKYVSYVKIKYFEKLEATRLSRVCECFEKRMNKKENILDVFPY